MTIDTGVLFRICKILDFDFFSLYSEDMKTKSNDEIG
jgi:hypothetical protein